MADLAEQVLKGDRLALSRLITHIENDSQDHHAVLDQLFPHTGKAHIIGVTGPSGSGKSTLVNRLALNLVGGENGKQSHKIGIIAVDPTSPFTGGALLGDRVRMRDLADNPDIFIRSMASRGALGGIARAADSAALVMDAAGFEIILIETVGAGQSEVEIARLAHTTIVVEAPGLGDDIQAAKAGILEALEREKGTDYQDLLNELLLRIPERKSPLLFAADMVTAIILVFYELRDKAAAKRLVPHLRWFGPPGWAAPYSLAGFGLALSLVEKANRRATSLLLSYSQQFHEHLDNLTGEDKARLSDFAYEVLRAVGL